MFKYYKIYDGLRCYYFNFGCWASFNLSGVSCLWFKTAYISYRKCKYITNIRNVARVICDLWIGKNLKDLIPNLRYYPIFFSSCYCHRIHAVCQAMNKSVPCKWVSRHLYEDQEVSVNFRYMKKKICVAHCPPKCREVSRLIVWYMKRKLWPRVGASRNWVKLISNKNCDVANGTKAAATDTKPANCGQ